MTQKRRLPSVLVLVLLLSLLFPLLPTAGASTLATERRIFDFVTGELGMNSAAACGILANMEAESSFTTTVWGDNGTSFGLCQWHNDRFSRLRGFCASRGYDYTSLEGQLQYLAFELKTSYPSTYNYLRNVSDTSDGAYDAAYYWCVHFEVPADREARGNQRGRTAQMKYWVRYGGSADFGTDFSQSMQETYLDSRGYNSSVFSAPDTYSDSFYWEQAEEDPEAEVPVTAAPSAAPPVAPSAPAPTEHQALSAQSPSAEPEVRTRQVYRFRYVPHHLPVSPMDTTGASLSPLSCVFLCAGMPKDPYTLPDPEETEAES